MRPVTPVLLILAAAASSACSSVHVTTDWDRSVDFAALRTFAWMPRGADEPDPFAGNTIVEKRVTAAVERELASKGLRRDDASPSFRVAVHTLTRERLDVTSWPAWGYGWRGRRAWGWDRVDVTQYTEGALVLDFVDPASQDLLWRGVARSPIDAASGSPERVDEAVRKLFADFPPAR